MIDDQKKEHFKELLSKRRQEIFRLRQNLTEARQNLLQPEIEPEESAKKEKMALNVETLEDREKQEIEAIDWALRKLETGSFGLCEACGGEISTERLEAVPWTRVCRQCAGNIEASGPGPGDEIQGGPAASEYKGLSDKELADAVRDN